MTRLLTTALLTAALLTACTPPQSAAVSPPPSAPGTLPPTEFTVQEPGIYTLTAAWTADASFSEGIDLDEAVVVDGDSDTADLTFRMNIGRGGPYATLTPAPTGPVCWLDGEFASVEDVAASTDHCYDLYVSLWTSYLGPDQTELRALQIELENGMYAGLITAFEADGSGFEESTATLTLTLLRME